MRGGPIRMWDVYCPTPIEYSWIGQFLACSEDEACERAWAAEQELRRFCYPMPLGIRAIPQPQI